MLHVPKQLGVGWAHMFDVNEAIGGGGGQRRLMHKRGHPAIGSFTHRVLLM